MAQPSIKDVKSKLKLYRYGDQSARDIHALLTNFTTLKVQDPKRFVHPNGSSENLVSVSGTIPVKIRGHTYNIPIAIWLKTMHPYHCPIVFVTPTQEMGIQQSRFVDTNGMVYLPYLSEWKQGSSDLTALTQVMCATFVDFCPVFSRRSAPPQPQPWQQSRPIQPPASYQTPTPGYPPQPHPPQPHSPYPTGQYHTPYPAGPTQMPTPYRPAGGYTPPPAQGAQPPYPTGGQYPGMYPPTSQPTSSIHPGSPSIHPGSPSIQPPPTTSILAGTAAISISEEEERRHFEESERIKRQSLESAVEDKIRRHVKQVLDSAQVEMESLQLTNKHLKKGSQRINQMLQEMENKQREVDQSVEMLQSKNTELMSVLEYLRAQPENVDVDGAVTATSPLFNQILQLYAEENAIDDTIYYLGEALRKGVIELDVFLKHVRELSRQQFMARATIMKARVAAGLPSHGIA